MEPYRATMKAIIQKIGYDYDIDIVELEIPEDHIHMVIRSVPKQSPSDVMQVIKSITAREFFRIYPEIKKKHFLLAGGDQEVMHTVGAVLDEVDHGSAQAAEEHITGPWMQGTGRHPGVMGRKPFGKIVGTEGKEVRGLLTLRRGEAEPLAFLCVKGVAVSGRNLDCGHRVLPF
mgnify:CR=1 FL=1